MRNFLSVVAGLVAGRWVIALLQRFVAPIPVEVDLRDLETIRAWAAEAPSSWFARLLVLWAVGAFVAGLVTALLATGRRQLLALVVGAIQTAVAVVQFLQVKHPTWVMMTGIALFVPFSALGARLFADPPEEAPAPATKPAE